MKNKKLAKNKIVIKKLSLPIFFLVFKTSHLGKQQGVSMYLIQLNFFAHQFTLIFLRKSLSLTKKHKKIRLLCITKFKNVIKFKMLI